MISEAQKNLSANTYTAIYNRINSPYYKFLLINVVIIAMLIAFKESLYFLPIVWIILTSVLIQVILYFYGVFAPQSSLFLKVIQGNEYFGPKKAILFRFDDGPDPRYTPQILDLLKEHHIRANFAVTGERAEKYPHIVKRMAEENHTISNHSYSHSYLISLFSYKHLLREIQRTNDIIYNITGQTPEYYCPPMGHKNLAMRRVLMKTGQKVMGWDIRTYDTKYSKDEIVNQVKKHLKTPAIILFHDGVFKWTKENRDSTIESLGILIDHFVNKGYAVN